MRIWLFLFFKKASYVQLIIDIIDNRNPMPSLIQDMVYIYLMSYRLVYCHIHIPKGYNHPFGREGRHGAL